MKEFIENNVIALEYILNKDVFADRMLLKYIRSSCRKHNDLYICKRAELLAILVELEKENLNYFTDKTNSINFLNKILLWANLLEIVFIISDDFNYKSFPSDYKILKLKVNLFEIFSYKITRIFLNNVGLIGTKPFNVKSYEMSFEKFRDVFYEDVVYENDSYLEMKGFLINIKNSKIKEDQSSIYFYINQ